MLYLSLPFHFVIQNSQTLEEEATQQMDSRLLGNRVELFL